MPTLRRAPAETSDLGAYGAKAVEQALRDRGSDATPPIRASGRNLERRGARDGGKRVRGPPPPRGWYQPEVAGGRAGLDGFDVVEGRVIKDGPRVEVLDGIPRGRVVSPRRTSASGPVEVHGRSFAVEDHWPNRPVRVGFDPDAGRMQFFALRRREPKVQAMLGEVNPHIPERRFNE